MAALGSVSLAPVLAQTEPAGGAAIDQIVIATVAASLIFGVLALVCIRHRAGRGRVLHVLGERASTATGLPAWAALPTGLAGISLIVALLGMYWDISLHIDVGRDEGPLANPAHYLILAGLFGVLAAGMLAIYMPDERPGPSAIKLTRDWYAPVGGIMLTACGAFALIGFPLDDVWHRIFGQDVTLWGPTHLMLIGGATMTVIGMANLVVEGVRNRDAAIASGARPAPDARERKIAARLVTARRVGLMGALLIGLSTFQGEFDFGVPQFALELEPMMLALAASMALVCARLWIGTGGAIAAALFFVVVRGLVSVLVGPVFGQTTPHLPLYLAEAVLIEAIAFALLRFRGRVPALTLGAIGGLAIGTIGFAAEYGWSQIGMPIAWTPGLIVPGMSLAIAAGLAGGLTGALLADALRGEMPGRRLATGFAVASLGVVMVATAFGLRTDDITGVTAQMKLSEPTQGATGEVADVEVRFEPAAVADDALWVTSTAWQGGGLEVEDLTAVPGEPGVYRTPQPVPIDGTWKTMLRIHTGDSLIAAPVFLPEDPAIPAAEVPAPAAGQPLTRELQPDIELLQREQKQGVATWLKVVAPIIVLGIALSLILLLGWGSNRVGRSAGGSGTPPGSSRVREPARPGGVLAGARRGAPFTALLRRILTPRRL